MHQILTDIFNEHPKRKVRLSLGSKPRVFIDGDATIEVSELPSRAEPLEPLTPESMAEIVNTLLTEQEASALKITHEIETSVDDNEYRRHITAFISSTSFTVDIKSVPLSYYDEQEHKWEETKKALDLLTGH